MIVSSAELRHLLTTLGEKLSDEEAEQLLARYRRIEDTGAISASQIDEARTTLDAARIELQQAEIALD